MYHLEVDKKRKVLLVRVDRIGDLILTLPADAHFAASDCTWLVAKGLGFIPQLAAPQRKFAETEALFSLRQFFSLFRWLRSEHFDAVLIFYAPAWVFFLVWLVRIPRRLGRWSQWYSFLFLNGGFRQSRKNAEKSELQYNLELALVGKQRLGGAVPLLSESGFAPLRLEAPKSERVRALGLQKYFVVHPGMSGSARNWTTSGWVQLILELSAYGPVVITGTSSDRIHLDPIEPQVKGRCVWLVDKLNPQELIEVLGGAKLVVAPSTGVIHLAASTGVPTLGIYSPVVSQSARRWAPQGPKVRTLTPLVECPAIDVCQGSACRHFDCLGLVRVSDLIEQAKSLGAL